MYVIGTAGHVDHGKSTLVEALTGIDPDRLREEKERGMTIDLGFAWLPLPDGNEVSIVDVPGHERFVNNMLAGVGGIDLALLVVAADESVMPQTREHLAILDLLQIKRGMVAVTKSDLVDEDWLNLVVADVEDILKDTTLEKAPIVTVSATTGQGLPELVSTLQGLLEEAEPRKDLGRPRLPVDRSFTMTGFGTVVTGTLVDGKLEVGQEVELVACGASTRIRGMQTHRKKLEQASPGSRVAANLAGISHEKIQRGEVMTTPGWLKPTTAMDVHLRVLSDSPRAVRHNMFVTVHTGSSETLGRLRLLEKQLANPGESAWAQLKLDNPVAVVKGDYFVIRSGGTTLGGGSIVDPHARRHRRMHIPVLERLSAIEKGSDQEVLLRTIETEEPSPLKPVADRANLQLDAAKAELQAMTQERLVVILGPENLGPGSLLYTAAGWSGVADDARSWLGEYHKRYPLRKGAPKEELRGRLGMSSQVANLAFPRLAKEEVLEEEESLARLPDFQPRLNAQQNIAAEDYLKTLTSNPYSPPTDMPIDGEVLNLLAEEGKVVKVSETVVFAASAFEDMIEKIRSRIDEHGETTVADVRDMLGTSRKYALALMDYLDRQRITRRVGDARVLR